jgi:hypothetical protein
MRLATTRTGRLTNMPMPDALPYALGRVFEPDDRDRLYPIQLVLDRLSPARRTTPWRRPRVLDQGQTGTCVGHGWRGWFESEPTIHAPSDGPDAFTIYRRAVLLDGDPSNDGDATAPVAQLQSGTSVRAGAKAMQEAGLIGSYVWASRAKEISDYVTRVDGSPVVVGTRWYHAMFSLDAKGRVKISGGIDGGHCYVVDWWNGRTFECYTSWGQFGLTDEYGISGRFDLSMAQLDRLIREQGEACCGVEMVVTPQPA